MKNVIKFNGKLYAPLEEGAHSISGKIVEVFQTPPPSVNQEILLRQEPYPVSGQEFYTKGIMGPFRWKKYKPEGARQMKVNGRWQEANEFGGWENCEKPNGPWITLEERMASLKGGGE